MFSKSSIIFAFLAVAKLAVATPPACILAAIGPQPDPTDFGTLCSGKVASNIQSYLSSKCGSQANAAQGVFADTCKQAGHQVAAVSVSPSATPSASGTGSRSTSVGTATSVVGGGSATTTVTKTGSGSGSSSTASGAAVAGRKADGAMIGGVIALAGLLAAI